MATSNHPPPSRFTFLPTRLPQAMAHRGGKGKAPENTMAAFANAVSLGYLYLETDVHLSADGALVAFHDDDLRRLTGRPSTISSLTWEELQQIDLGNNHRIPRLADLLDAFPDARFTIDPKADAAVEPLIELIASTGSIERVCVGSFEAKRTQRARSTLGPTLCTSPAAPGVAKLLLAAYFRPSWNHPYGCVQIPERAYGIRLGRAGLIKRLQRLGLQVHFWTINERSAMERLLDAGADVLITDEVGVLKDLLIERGQWSTDN